MLFRSEAFPLVLDQLSTNGSIQVLEDVEHRQPQELQLVGDLDQRVIVLLEAVDVVSPRDPEPLRVGRRRKQRVIIGHFVRRQQQRLRDRDRSRPRSQSDCAEGL